MTRLFRLASVLAALAIVSPAALAAPPRAAQLTPQQQNEVQQITQYLNSIRTMTARFAQHSENGGLAQGKVYVQRPGQMRFEYDPPSPILLLADGWFVIYYDKSLNQTSYLPIGSTPAWFLLRNDIRLGGDVTVVNYEHTPGAIRVTLVQTKEPDAGAVTLTFSDRPLELKQWSIVDAQGKRTVVALSDVRIGAPVDEKLFSFKGPSRDDRRQDRLGD
jgi:outer membrane lipoprotein-sorting protein